MALHHVLSHSSAREGLAGFDTRTHTHTQTIPATLPPPAPTPPPPTCLISGTSKLPMVISKQVWNDTIWSLNWYDEWPKAWYLSGNPCGA